MAKKLTEKQEKFSLALHETGNKSEAYRRAYNATNMSPAAINNAAYILSKDPLVILRMAELRKESLERCQAAVGDKNLLTGVSTIMDGNAEAVARKLVELALDGDLKASKLVLEFTSPQRQLELMEIMQAEISNNG